MILNTRFLFIFIKSSLMIFSLLMFLFYFGSCNRHFLTFNSCVILQALDFGKLVGMLKAEETEDTIVSACQKLISLFQQRPEQKHVFLSQNGFVPLMELLGVRKIRVSIYNMLVTDKWNNNFHFQCDCIKFFQINNQTYLCKDTAIVGFIFSSSTYQPDCQGQCCFSRKCLFDWPCKII